MKKKFFIIGLLFVLPMLIFAYKPLTQYYVNGEMTVNIFSGSQKEGEHNWRVITYENGMVRIEGPNVEIDLDTIGRKRLVYFMQVAQSKNTFETETIIEKVVGNVRGLRNIKIVISLFASKNGKVVLDINQFHMNGIEDYETVVLTNEDASTLINLLNKSDDLLKEHISKMEKLK